MVRENLSIKGKESRVKGKEIKGEKEKRGQRVERKGK